MKRGKQDQQQRQIGSGSFGTVVQSTKKKGVVKKTPLMMQGRYQHAFRNEVRIYEMLSAISPPLPFVPVYFGRSEQQQGGRSFQMQKIHPDLTHLLRRLTPQKAESFFSHAFQSLSQLHRYLFHMDLGLQNVGFRGDSGQIVFFDFGASIPVKDPRLSTDMIHLLQRKERNDLYGIFEDYCDEYREDLYPALKRAYAPYKTRMFTRQQRKRVEEFQISLLP